VQFCNFVEIAVMDEIIFLVEESPEGGYSARALGESIYTEADSIEELKVMIKDAVICHFDSENLPKVVRMHFVKDETFAIA
jgi:hypothetical protein